MNFKILDICDINCNNLSKKDNWEYINYLDTANLNEGIITELQNLVIEKDKIPSRAKRKVENNDILISTVRPNQKHYGILKNIKENMIVSTGFAVLSAKADIVDSEYLYRYLTQENITAYLQAVAETSTSAYPSIKPSVIGDLEICLPLLEEQKAIAHILSTLDKKIEINNQINKKLEEMAQAIFKQWFVDFEFPKVDGKPYKSSGGEMVESELGMIPKGWKVLDISSILDVKDGTHNSPKAVDDGYPLITSKHLMDTKLDFKSANRISEKDYYEINKRSKVNRHDILISMIGTVGNLYLVQNKEINFAIKNVGLFKTSERLDLYEYIYCYLNTPKIKQYIKARMAGSTQQYISLGELRKIPIIIPNVLNISLIENFKSIVNPMFYKVYILSNEIENLIKLRDTLLPKLMSGEIRVPLND